MKIYNRFTIDVVFDDEAKCNKLKERLENMIEDLDITKKSLKNATITMSSNSNAILVVVVWLMELEFVGIT